MRGPDGSNKVLLVDHCEGQCRAIVGFKNGDPGTARCFSLLNSSSGAHDDTDRRDNPLEVPYSTGLIHAAFFCELKQHSVNMRAFTFACQITKLDCPKWIDDDKYCATENEFQCFVCPACSRLHWMNSKTGKLFEGNSLAQRAS